MLCFFPIANFQRAHKPPLGTSIMDRYMPPDADGGAQHVVHTMTAKSPEQKAAGSLLAENPLPVPLSRFSFRHQSLAPRRQTPRCSHSVMDRFYGDEDDRCDFCHRQGAFGWLYRCNMDRDALIMAEKQKGHPVSLEIPPVTSGPSTAAKRCI